MTREEDRKDYREAFERAGLISVLDTPETQPREIGFLLNTQERRVLKRLVQAWSEFIKLDSYHPKDTTEFEQAIHRAQDLVLARPAREWLVSNEIRLDEIEP